MGDEYEMNWWLIGDERGLNQSWQEKVCSMKKNVPSKKIAIIVAQL